MSAVVRQAFQTNPFSTRWVRPGAIPYLFPPSDSLSLLVERLRANGWRGQIIGPHGSGKSTLLAALLPELVCAGVQPVVHKLHDWQRRLPNAWWRQVRRSEPTIVVIDGCEQLGRWTWFMVKRHCRRHSLGLLITSHRSAGLPHLYFTAITLETAKQVFGYLTQGTPSPVTLDNVEARLAARSGNLREALFDLYDLHELAVAVPT